MRALALLALLALTAFARPAAAQTNVVINCQTGTTATGAPIFAPASAANPCPVTGGGGGGGGGTSSNFAAAFPTAGTALGVTDGTNMRAITGINYSGSNYAIAAQLFGTVPLPTGASTAANQATEISSLATIATNTGATGVAQGSTTAGQLGPLIQGTVATGVAAYTNATTQPLNITTAGTLKATLYSSAGTVMNGTFSTATAAPSVGIGALGIFNSAAPPLTNGQATGLQLDATGNLLTGQRAITPGVANAAATNVIAKASAGTLFDAYVTTGATAGWLMVFNSATVPADGATTAGTASGNLQQCIVAPANLTTSISFPSSGEVYSAGITVVFSSTTCATKTAAASGGFIHARVQ